MVFLILLIDIERCIQEISGKYDRRFNSRFSSMVLLWVLEQVVQELTVPGRVLGASAHQYWLLDL